MYQGSFYSKILNIKINGKVEKILPKELQYHPVTDKLIHFDFLRVQDDTKKFGKLELSPKFEGRQMTMVIQPL